MANMYDIVIVGGGPGGYSAALYAARAGLHVVVLEKRVIGGQAGQIIQSPPEHTSKCVGNNP